MSYDNEMVEAKCQVCGEPVMIKENTPYFGILCAKCSKPKSYRFENKRTEAEKTNKGHGVHTAELQYADCPCTNRMLRGSTYRKDKYGKLHDSGCKQGEWGE